jgi:hypothetical protein
MSGQSPTPQQTPSASGKEGNNPLPSTPKKQQPPTPAQTALATEKRLFNATERHVKSLERSPKRSRTSQENTNAESSLPAQQATPRPINAQAPNPSTPVPGNLANFSRIMKDLQTGDKISSNSWGIPDDYLISGVNIYGFDEIVLSYTGKGKNKAVDTATFTPISSTLPDFSDPHQWTKFFDDDIEEQKKVLSGGSSTLSAAKALWASSFETPSKPAPKETAKVKEEIDEGLKLRKVPESQAKPTRKEATKEEPIVIDETFVDDEPIIIDGSPQGGKKKQKAAKVANSAPTFEEMKAKIDQEYRSEQGNRHVDLSFSGMGQQLSGYSGSYQYCVQRG